MGVQVGGPARAPLHATLQFCPAASPGRCCLRVWLLHEQQNWNGGVCSMLLSARSMGVGTIMVR